MQLNVCDSQQVPVGHAMDIQEPQTCVMDVGVLAAEVKELVAALLPHPGFKRIARRTAPFLDSFPQSTVW